MKHAISERLSVYILREDSINYVQGTIFKKNPMKHQELGQAIVYANRHPKETSKWWFMRSIITFLIPAIGQTGPSYWKK